MHQFLNKVLKVTNSERIANKYHSHLETIATLYSYKKSRNSCSRSCNMILHTEWSNYVSRTLWLVLKS